ncbi:hypothetical protein PISMIDRAFT_196709 [Pisolithus microcarpus 441]|uniref:Unplaced genomic scaffold scaffold_127, whole genome shotgun sequence n=1 Tax=Pisolithus microcarpus 441 TaxID=765257 RepID=A0A0C9Y097_9AGAM|nr:hypothetical protein PISMIDRAFT_196709 [Pisolithus microcarpus 441]
MPMPYLEHDKRTGTYCRSSPRLKYPLPGIRRHPEFPVSVDALTFFFFFFQLLTSAVRGVQRTELPT